jgi:hypothetical protein
MAIFLLHEVLGKEIPYLLFYLFWDLKPFPELSSKRRIWVTFMACYESFKPFYHVPALIYNC